MEREPGFYWVIPIFDVDTDADDWRQKLQPAHWDGTRWAMLDTEDWGEIWVEIWVGDKIEAPNG
jgi:hypothetical protein